MRGSDILQPSKDKAGKWGTGKDTHIGHVTLEDVEPLENSG